MARGGDDGNGRTDGGAAAHPPGPRLPHRAGLATAGGGRGPGAGPPDPGQITPLKSPSNSGVLVGTHGYSEGLMGTGWFTATWDGTRKIAVFPGNRAAPRSFNPCRCVTSRRRWAGRRGSAGPRPFARSLGPDPRPAAGRRDRAAAGTAHGLRPKTMGSGQTPQRRGENPSPPGGKKAATGPLSPGDSVPTTRFRPGGPLFRVAGRGCPFRRPRPCP
jgi:hypothetical protein